VAQQNDSAFLEDDDSPLFSDDETHAAALSTSSPVRFPLMDLTNEVSICRTFCYIGLLNIQCCSLVESLARGTEARILSLRSDNRNGQKLR
jgi:hypothetical protein